MTHVFRERAESLSAWWKPVDGGSNPPAPTLTHRQQDRPFAKPREILHRGVLGSRLSYLRATSGTLTWRFSATASWIRALSAGASIVSPSRMSIARRVLPSRLELKSFRGSFREAPRAKVSFTTCL